jgi:hypothetical protein
MYYLNQLGITRDNMSPQQFAGVIDKQIGSNFNSFTDVYQKVKYSNMSLTTNEEATVQKFYEPFKEQVRNTIPFKKRFGNFLNIYHTLHFFTNKKIS